MKHPIALICFLLVLTSYGQIAGVFNSVKADAYNYSHYDNVEDFIASRDYLKRAVINLHKASC